MNAGDLRDRIEVVRKTRTTDGMGGWSETESTLLTVWAQVLTPRSKTGVVAHQDAEIRTHEIAIRYSALPAINDIVKHLGDRLEVKGVRYDAKRQWTFLDCVPEVE